LKTVDEYIDNLPEERKVVIEYIREMILSEVPGIQEKLSFKIPFYHYFGMFMYLNNTAEGIDIGFCRGKDLTEAFPQLALKGRAIVASILIRSKKDIIDTSLREIIVAAAIWNEEAKRLKIAMVKKPTKKKAK
jgi:uncharacterized protein